MSKLIQYNRKNKNYYVAVMLIVLALLNFRIIIKNEIINYRIYSIILTNVGWYFFSFLLLLVLQVKKIYKILFIKKNSIVIENDFDSYKIIGIMIGNAIIELILMTFLVILVIAINLELIDISFLKQSLDALELSGINPSREIPFIFLILILSYTLILETIYFSLAVVKTLFKRFKYKKMLSYVIFNFVSFINLFVIYNMQKNVINYSLTTTIFLTIKIVLMIVLWFMLISFLLNENNFSK